MHKGAGKESFCQMKVRTWGVEGEIWEEEETEREGKCIVVGDMKYGSDRVKESVQLFGWHQEKFRKSQYPPWRMEGDRKFHSRDEHGLFSLGYVKGGFWS